MLPKWQYSAEYELCLIRIATYIAVCSLRGGTATRMEESWPCTPILVARTSSLPCDMRPRHSLLRRAGYIGNIGSLLLGTGDHAISSRMTAWWAFTAITDPFISRMYYPYIGIRLAWRRRRQNTRSLVGSRLSASLEPIPLPSPHNGNRSEVFKIQAISESAPFWPLPWTSKRHDVSIRYCKITIDYSRARFLSFTYYGRRAR